MRRIIKHTAELLLLLALLPLCMGCNNEDDIIEIFTGKTWKLSRLTIKDSSERFHADIWDSDAAYKSSLNALEQKGTFTLTFEGSEVGGEITGTNLSGKGIKATISGTWSVDGKKKTLRFSIKAVPSETDPLAKAFLAGLEKVESYDGDVHSLTLFYNDGQTTKVMGFIPQ